MNLISPDTLDLVGGAIGLVLTLLVFSYLMGDNVLFRFVLHIFIGVTAGYVAVVVFYEVVWPKLFLPLFDISSQNFLWLILPLIFSLLLLTRVSGRFSVLSTPLLAFLVGVGAATAIGGSIFGLIFPQVTAAINSFDIEAIRMNQENINVALLNSSVVLAGTICSLVYFHFGSRMRSKITALRPAWIEWLAQIGKGFIAVAFGMIFAGVYTAALVAFIDRYSFVTEFLISIMGKFFN